MEKLKELLKERFEKHQDRHPHTTWQQVEEKLTPAVLTSLDMMEQTGGEVDVVEVLPGVGLAYVDMAKETPKGRVSVCYDKLARTTRKTHPPKTSVEEMAHEMNVNLLDERQYRYLQTIISLDTKTSSWIATPQAIRDLKGALFADNRYETIFVYHNGADSYYASRGFRAYKAL
ncbi:hypothetical protein A4S06_03635 [Erysipelotrichaceae bacterium MTC7]|nr:hypothetical protein A4S06_03635 [Erysipelotrichaceae bacterium MTC7]